MRHKERIDVKNIKEKEIVKVVSIGQKDVRFRLQNAYVGQVGENTELLDETLVDNMLELMAKAVKTNYSKYNPVPNEIIIRNTMSEKKEDKPADNKESQDMIESYEPRFALEQVALNEKVKEQIQTAIAAVRYKTKMTEEWGMSEYFSGNRAVILNFYGKAGTGKMEKLMPTANQKHIEENVPITEWDNPYFEVKEPEQMAFSIKDKFVSIQTCTEGYDYSVFDEDYRLIDGGVYDNSDISIHAALKDILEDFGLSGQDKRIPVDYEEIMKKTEAVEREQLSKRIREEVPEADNVVADFKAKTEELFNGINGQTQDDIEQTVWAYLQSEIDEYGIDVELVDVVVSGSRCRGLEKAGSDLDVVVEYKGREHEDDLFNAFNEDGLMIGGIKVDINPITEGKTGTLATYLPGVESYLAEKQAMQKASAVEATPEKTVTLTVAECGEFHSLGEFHENIASVEEAIAVWKSIPPERMNGIPSIGINIHTEGTERYEDVEIDILSGKVIDLEVLDYVPDITDDPKAIEVMAELIDKLPDIEVRGSLEKWQAAILASQIDQFSYDYDTYQYRDTVEDREAQVANITEDIRNGNTGYMNDFLNAVISEGVREGITDIFGQGVEIDDSEAVQTARRAKELLDKLAEYKPLAKVEELEEQNYNMIDNVLNNGAEKKEQEQTKGRISIKEKLAEKKAVIEQRDKAERTSPEKETEKKSQREM